MTRKPLQLLIALTCSTPLSAVALGVGQIQVRSALNQTLEADIPLLLANPAEAAGINVKLASAPVFAQRGIERPAFLTELAFAVQTSPDGRGYIRVTSKRPVREPLLDFLVQIEWPKGQIVREFAALLDPPLRTAAQREPAVVAPPRSRRTAAPETRPAVAAPAVTHRGTATYGPIPYGATLWNIASQVRPDPSISVNRMMQALLQANPKAFWKPGVDGLRAGAALRIPSAQEIDPIRFPDELSRQLVARQQVPAPPPAAKPQVKLVPPETTAEPPQPEPPPPRKTAATAPAAAAPFTIRLKGSHPELHVAGLDELRQRIAASGPGPERATDQEPATLQSLSPATRPTETKPQVSQRPQAALPIGGEPPPLSEAQPPLLAGGSLAQPETRLQEALPAALSTKPPVAPNETRETGPVPVTGMPASRPHELSPTERAPSRPPVSATAIPPSAGTPPPAIDRPVTFPPPAEPSGSLLAEWLTPVSLILLSSLLILISAVMLWLRRRGLGQEMGEETLAIEGVQPVQETAQTALPSRKTSIETEPVTRTRVRTAPNSLGRADLLLAVGNYADAAKVVRQALDEEPANTSLQAKLLDIHFAARDPKAFLRDAQTLLDHLGNTVDPLWLHVAEMGRELCPEQALFRKADELFLPTKTITHPEVTAAFLHPAAALADDAAPAEIESTLFIDLDAAEESPTKPERATLTDLDWPLSDLDQPTVKTLTSAQTAPPEQVEEDDRTQPLDELDWQFPEMEPATEPVSSLSHKVEQPAATAPAEQNLDVDSLFTREITGSKLTKTDEEMTLSFEAITQTAAHEPLDEPAGSLQSIEFNLEDHTGLKLDEPITGVDYVETKLDLATAYLDLGDPVGAHNLLQEVLQEGNDSQQQKARALLAKLPI